MCGIRKEVIAFNFDDAFPDGSYLVPAECRYNMRKAYERYIELGRVLIEEEMEEFKVVE